MLNFGLLRFQALVTLVFTQFPVTTNLRQASSLSLRDMTLFTLTRVALVFLLVHDEIIVGPLLLLQASPVLFQPRGVSLNVLQLRSGEPPG